MRIYIVIASVNELLNIVSFKEQLIKNANEIKIIVIDEGDEKIREKNRQILQGLQYEFYGPNERRSWFSARFGNNYEKYLTVIPEKCHAETSFGFLVAYEEGADVIIELDDDCFYANGHDLIRGHLNNLFHDGGFIVYSNSKWYNTIENLVLNCNLLVFPRGHPYASETRVESYKSYSWREMKTKKCVLNMGLWGGHPDIDALTILYNGGLDGRSSIKSISLKRDKVIVDKGAYFAICSMNTSFQRKIVPAFYQLHMKAMGIDRFDDIWSGLFIKKIADQLGDSICLGKPLVYHDKRPRSTFKDLKAELEGMIMNEVLWKIVDSLELSGKDYFECYSGLANGIERNIEKFSEKVHRDFISLQVEKMKLWLEVLDKISG
jgi:hypothetical protein